MSPVSPIFLSYPVTSLFCDIATTTSLLLPFSVTYIRLYGQLFGPLVFIFLAIWIRPNASARKNMTSILQNANCKKIIVNIKLNILICFISTKNVSSAVSAIPASHGVLEKIWELSAPPRKLSADLQSSQTTKPCWSSARRGVARARPLL